MLFIIPSWGRASRKHLISMISSIDPFYIIHDILEGPLWAWKPLGSHLREDNIPGHGYSQTPDCDTLASCWSQKFVQAWSLWRARHQASWPYRPASSLHYFRGNSVFKIRKARPEQAIKSENTNGYISERSVEENAVNWESGERD